MNIFQLINWTLDVGDPENHISRLDVDGVVVSYKLIIVIIECHLETPPLNPKTP